ncbi:glycerophosphoinositol inositolphosphodiesterase GDPD2 isoform X2 [Mugil cephalus]|uniref:glycerophosphoinositol inositolphosphodiesterase GDPD2 isoform X2 n=1 Tax=Mugil cephalus TaxID=48193 RepID=UPI001FB6FD8D|nr:glycerophosphoinositol inositolphosphodiesterase GDPD2 isoform X2 [Mugil cephalus]
MREGCCRVCSRGFYSCHWRHSHGMGSKRACWWFSFVAVAFLLSLCWMYIWLVSFNDREDVNWKMFQHLKRWVNWFMVVIVVSAVLTSYCTLLLLFALFQVALGEQLNLHWLHKIFLFFGAIIITCMIAGICLVWPQEWPTIPLSLQATAPFLHFGAVGALTLLSLFVFQRFHTAKKGSMFLIAMFLVVSAAILLCPLWIQSPCLIKMEELPEKPKLIGHRGAPMLAPENTMMSFNRSVECGVTVFETDVQLSKNRVPFLMHDNGSEFLLRTTNVQERFPNKTFNNSTEITFKELRSLNAGEWFLKTDPFHSVSQLSDDERKTARSQTIPSLHDLLDLAKQHNISVLFDLYSPNQKNDARDTEDIVKTISESGINQNLVLWLPPATRNMTPPGFIQIYNNEKAMREENGSHLNVKYSALSMGKIRNLTKENYTVNLYVVNERWLFSLLWCAGASSVTTNACHLLKDVDEPDWVLDPFIYKIIWISVDIVSVVIMMGLYIFERAEQRQYSNLQRKRDGSSFLFTPVTSFSALPEWCGPESA